MMRCVAIFVFSLAAAVQAQILTKLQPQTNAAFEQYVSAAERVMLERAKAESPLPWLGEEALPRVRKGELEVRSYTGDTGKPVPGGLIHDWVGGILLRGAKLNKAVALTQDFARHKQWFPEVVDSERLGQQGSTVKGMWLLKKKKLITVVLRAELSSEYHAAGANHGYLISRTGPLIEVEDFGTASQHDYPPGEGHGFLWRFNGYWTFHQSPEGVYAECRVISLSREVPPGLGWIVNPFLSAMPRESLQSTLLNTRNAVGQP